MVYMCEQKTRQKQTRAMDESDGMMDMRRPYRVGHLWGFPGIKKREETRQKNKNKKKKKTLSGPRRHDTWDLER